MKQTIDDTADYHYLEFHATDGMPLPLLEAAVWATTILLWAAAAFAGAAFLMILLSPIFPAPPALARVHRDALQLDARTLAEQDLEPLAAALQKLAR